MLRVLCVMLRALCGAGARQQRAQAHPRLDASRPQQQGAPAFLPASPDTAAAARRCPANASLLHALRARLSATMHAPTRRSHALRDGSRNFSSTVTMLTLLLLLFCHAGARGAAQEPVHGAAAHPGPGAPHHHVRQVSRPRTAATTPPRHTHLPARTLPQQPCPSTLQSPDAVPSSAVATHTR